MTDTTSSAVLNRPTLVLNRGWQPVGVAPVARAVIMVWNETAQIVDPTDYQTYTWSDWAELAPNDDEPAIRTVRATFRAPEVITLTRFNKQVRHVVTFSRRNLFRRDGYTCQYCGAKPGPAELTIDHILPKSRGGLTTWENCVLACIKCNSRKADRMPREANMHLRSTPKRPNWSPIFNGRAVRIASWSRFISEAYWNVPLEP